MRKSVLKRLIPYFERYASVLLPDLTLKCSYRQGWKKDIDFTEALAMAMDTDIKMKFTTTGPHRADIVFKDDTDKAVDVLSRGQLKLLLCALKLGQMALLKEETGMTAVVLMDDLPAELDTAHRKQLLTLLHDIGSQVFVTTTDRNLLDYSAWSDVKLFHVEHGQMKEVV
jgi:DNA replication and repair protein RecF